MEKALNKVVEFHKAVNAEICKQPSFLDCKNFKKAEEIGKIIRNLANLCAGIGLENGLLFSRLALNLEELSEWLDAHVRQDLVALADAWGDRQYALLGDAVSAGLPAEAIFEEIHRLNMSKAAGSVGGTATVQKTVSYRHQNAQTTAEDTNRKSLT